VAQEPWYSAKRIPTLRVSSCLTMRSLMFEPMMKPWTLRRLMSDQKTVDALFEPIIKPMEAVCVPSLLPILYLIIIPILFALSLLEGPELLLGGLIYRILFMCHVALKHPKAGRKYWEVAKLLGNIIRALQFGIIAFGLLIRRHGPVLGSAPGLGFLLIVLGLKMQLEKDLVKETLLQVYVNKVQRHRCGVVLLVWGVCRAVAPSWNTFGPYSIVPWLETFWFIASMNGPRTPCYAVAESGDEVGKVPFMLFVLLLLPVTWLKSWFPWSNKQD